MKRCRCLEKVRLPRRPGSDVGSLSVDGVKLQKMPGRHGTIIPCGEAMGVLLSAADEEQLYIAGDTIWYEGVEQILKTYKPGVVALNACAAETVEHGRLFMGDEDVACVAQTLPSGQTFLTHYGYGLSRILDAPLIAGPPGHARRSRVCHAGRRRKRRFLSLGLMKPSTR